jgi:hypothetical protein
MQVKVKGEFLPLKFKDVCMAMETEVEKGTQARGQPQAPAGLHPGK